ncbi:TnpV protein [Frisingicoccus sp.]|uniref:TnpV protein n=1 Tax=Frisingicoccus sp. TaxID=1918627 RepID=UPI003AB56B52
MSRIDYIWTGEYQIPAITLETNKELGKYGMLRKRYLKENKEAMYSAMLMTGKLWEHLLKVEKQAEERMEIMTKQMLKAYPAPDKATNQMAWVQHMNWIHHSVEEIILKELIYS